MSRPPEGPEDVLALAHQWEREALRARAKGDVQRADQLDENAARARELVAAWQRLTGRNQSDTHKGMLPAARARISAGRVKGASAALMKMASAKGYTLRSLAEAVGCPQSIITRALGGTRRIRLSAARAIAKLTGFAATEKNWPGGWVSEDE